MNDDLISKLSSFAMDCHNDEQFTSLGRQSILEKKRKEVQEVLDEAMKYRSDILKQIGVFSTLSDEQLFSAAQIMNEKLYYKGDYIFKQGDVADAFFIIQEGLVEVTRKNNPTDPEDKEIFLKNLKTNAYFGEIALLTSDNRSANIRVVSDSAMILSMTKTQFLELTAVFNQKMSDARLAIAKDALRHVAMFAHLTKKSFEVVFNAFQFVTFLPNIHIFKQGMLGNTMYIITEGTCKVSFRNTKTAKDGNVSEEGRSISMPNLLPGDCFGEQALMERRHIRPTSVITATSVYCMQLTKTAFDDLTKGELGYEILGKKSALNARNSLMRSNMTMDIRTIELLKRRRLTAYNINMTKCSLKLSNLFKRVAKAYFESLVITMYFRMYRVMVLSTSITSTYGDHAETIMKINSTSRYEATSAIFARVKSICNKDIQSRNSNDMKFIVGLLSQKNELRNRMCESWSNNEFYNLCRTLTTVSFPKYRKIFDIGDKCSCAYVILSGSVRLFTQNSDTGSLVLEYDLASGEIFGQDALAGVTERTICALAMTAVDLLQVERDDFIDSQDQKNASTVATVEDRYEYLKKIAIFKGWEKFRLLRLAQSLNQEFITKGTMILKKGEESKNLYFIYSGRIDILSSHRKPFNIASLQKYDFFGETGYINSRKKYGKLVEEFNTFASSKTDVFVLSPDFFDYVDSHVYGQIGSIYDDKLRSRHEILHSLVLLHNMRLSNKSKSNSMPTTTSAGITVTIDQPTSSDIQSGTGTEASILDQDNDSITSSNGINDESSQLNNTGHINAALPTTTFTKSPSHPSRLLLPTLRENGRCFSESTNAYIMAPPPIFLDPLKRLAKNEKFDLEDIPNLCNGGINPLLVGSLSHPRLTSKLRQQIAAVKKPKYVVKTSI